MFANGRHKDAEKVLRKAARVSGVKLPPKLFHSVKQTSVELSVNYDTTRDSLEAKGKPLIDIHALFKWTVDTVF